MDATATEHLRRMKVAYFVLLIGLLSTLGVVLRVRENINARDQARFDHLANRVETSVERRVVRCVDQMYNLRALFAATESVERNEWDRYVATLAARHGELGIRSLGYAEKVTAETKAEFLKRRRADTETNFTIYPEGDRPIYYPAVYITHFDPEAQVIRGLDHAVQSQRLGTMEQAARANQPLATDRVKFIAPDGLHTNSGIFIYLPVYRNGSLVRNAEERRKALQGFIFIAFRPEKALAQLLGEQANQMDIEVFDGPEAMPDRLIYVDDGTLQGGDPKAHVFQRQMTIPVLNRRWTVLLATRPAFGAASRRDLQWITLVSGATVSVLLFAITWVQITARARAERDAAELHRSETALAVEKERLAVTLDSIADGVITTDTAGKIISINKAGESLTGWLHDEAEGESLSDVFRLINEETREPCTNPMEKVLQTRKTVETWNHTLLIARDGTERSIANSAALIRDVIGNALGVVLVFRDVTEKRRTEEQMLKETKLESVGLLAGGIAHDFNNLLLGIIGNLSLVHGSLNSPKEILELLTDMEKSAARAKDLTQQLLTFARGGQPVKRLSPLTGMIREACQFALRGSNVQCEYLLPGDAWPAEVDEGQFRQTLYNIMINAIQAMPEGGKIEVRLENLDLASEFLQPLPAGKYVKISIRDHGSGMKPEHLARVFEPYFTTKKQRSGLGLAAAYSVVRKHDGQMKVESTVGIGTTVQIYLPASLKPVTLPQPETRSQKCSGHGRLLIVDDEDAVLKVMSAMLDRCGFEVETARDGREAIERYTTARSAGRPFEAVIMDLTIPNGMGGREAISRLRELDPQVKAIASSGYSFDPVMANYRQHGFDGVIPKPYRLEDLSRILEEVIGN